MSFGSMPSLAASGDGTFPRSSHCASEHQAQQGTKKPRICAGLVIRPCGRNDLWRTAERVSRVTLFATWRKLYLSAQRALRRPRAQILVPALTRGILILQLAYACSVVPDPSD